MKISKSIVLPEWESIEDLSQASDILHKITEAMRNHQIENYDDSVANFRRVTTGRIQSQDGETYFDLDSGVIKGEIVFRKGSSGLDNIEEASPNDWDNAFRLANAVKGDDDFTLISGSKILTGSIAVGAFNSDVVARMFASETNKTNIEAWMKSGAITYIDGAKIYAGSITLTGLGTTIIDGGYIKTSLLTANNIRTGILDTIQIKIGDKTGGDIYFKQSGIDFYDAGSKTLSIYKASNATLSLGLDTTYSIVSSSTKLRVMSNTSPLELVSSGTYFYLHGTGTFQLPSLTSAPTGHTGDLAFDDEDEQTKLYTKDAWRHHVTYADW